MNKYYEIFEYYCEPFMKNFNKSTMRFDYNSSSKGIIQLADYDSCISTIVFKYIKILEKSFSSKIIYFMSKELSINTNNIFSNFHNIEKILNKYKIEKQLDFLSSFSFGELLKVFKNLNENIQYNIINSYN
ncbi:MAG: Abi family protein, partial [Ureaplasma sp.]|nr:Abi family protein [Ureaplasma sp.]